MSNITTGEHGVTTETSVVYGNIPESNHCACRIPAQFHYVAGHRAEFHHRKAHKKRNLSERAGISQECHLNGYNSV